MRLALRMVPRRERGVEFMDDPAANEALACRSLADVARSNRLFGGTSAVVAGLAPLIADARRAGRALTLLDVGTGAGDIPERARAVARGAGVQLTTVGLEITTSLARAARPRSREALAGDARELPFSSRSVDIVTCSQLLHHFDDAGAAAILAEMQRVARVRVIVADIRRTWFAAGGVWLASWALGFHPVSRHDGVVSVLRGFRVSELAHAVRHATGKAASVRNRPGCRVTASWSPA